MKVSANDLVKLVREIAQDEIKKQLPGLVREVLAESYLKQLVSEQQQPKKKAAAPPAKQSLAMALSIETDEEEPVPEPENPIADDHEGIYHPNNPMLMQRNEVASKLLSRNNPLSFVYEGVKPIPSGQGMSSLREDVSVPAPNEVPAQFLKNLDFDRMKKLSKAMEERAQSNRPMDETPNQKMRELEERRRRLEVPVNPDERK